jgi:capsular exopolysaccharide synthesis family protein
MADIRLPIPHSAPELPAYAPAPAWPAPAGPDLQELFRRLWRRKRMIAAITIGCTMLVTVALFLIAPRYTGSAQIMLGQPPTTNILDANQILAGMMPDTETVNSAIAVIQSRDLAGRVIDKLELNQDPELNPEMNPPPEWLATLTDPRSYLPTSWADALLGPSDEEISPVEKERANHNKIVDNFLKRLDAGAVGQSRVITISFRSESPGTAARVANAVADEYISSQLEQKFETTRAVNDWADKQIATLRQQVTEADKAVEEYRAKNGLVEGKGDTLPSQEAADLSTQLVQARADRAEAEAKLNQVQQLLASPNGIETANAVLQSQLIQSLRQQEALVEQTIADLSQTYGERHPKMISARAQLHDLEARIRAEIARIAKDYRNQVAVARAREASISAALDKTKAQIGELNQADVHLRSLQQEADTSRDLLAAFLARYKQTGSEENFRQPDAMLISHASEPDKPSFPKKRVLVALSIVAFGMLGTLIALLLEEFDRGMRSMGQVERLMGVRALGLIPSVSGLLGNQRRPEDYVVERPGSALSESLRGVHTALALSGGPQPKTVMFASSLPKEGKTSMALSYARLLATGGRKVVVVDCDLRRSALCRRLGLHRKPGLADYIGGRAELDDILHPDKKSSACIVPAGSAPAASATDILASNHFAAFLGALGEHYDVVVLDTPPVLAVSDTQLLCRLVDKTVFVVRWGRTRAETALITLRQLVEAGADIAGVLLSMVDVKKHARYGYGDAGSYYDELRRYYVG